MKNLTQREWNKLTSLLAIIGLVADSIAIYSFLLPNQIHPSIAKNHFPIVLSIIVVAFLTYWGFLRVYFFNKQLKGLLKEENFLLFYAKNIWEFKTPLLLIPLVILIGITVTVISDYLNTTGAIGILLIIIFIFWLPVHKYKKWNKANQEKLKIQESLEANTKKLDDLLQRLNNEISKELQGRGYITSFDLWQRHPYEHNWMVTLLECYYLQNHDKEVLFSRNSFNFPDGFPFDLLVKKYGIYDRYGSYPGYAINFNLEVGILRINNPLVSDFQLKNEIDLFVKKISIKEFYLLAKESKIELVK